MLCAGRASWQRRHVPAAWLPDSNAAACTGGAACGINACAPADEESEPSSSKPGAAVLPRPVVEPAAPERHLSKKVSCA